MHALQVWCLEKKKKHAPSLVLPPSFGLALLVCCLLTLGDIYFLFASVVTSARLRARTNTEGRGEGHRRNSIAWTARIRYEIVYFVLLLLLLVVVVSSFSYCIVFCFLVWLFLLGCSWLCSCSVLYEVWYTSEIFPKAEVVLQCFRPSFVEVSTSVVDSNIDSKNDTHITNSVVERPSVHLLVIRPFIYHFFLIYFIGVTAARAEFSCIM